MNLKFVSILTSVDGSSTRKMMRRAENDKAEDAVYKWFMQKFFTRPASFWASSLRKGTDFL